LQRIRQGNRQALDRLLQQHRAYLHG
jgi:hypothetical protein